MVPSQRLFRLAAFSMIVLPLALVAGSQTRAAQSDAIRLAQATDPKNDPKNDPKGTPTTKQPPTKGPDPAVTKQPPTKGPDPTMTKQPPTKGPDPAVTKQPPTKGPDPAVTKQPPTKGPDPALTKQPPTKGPDPTVTKQPLTKTDPAQKTLTPTGPGTTTTTTPTTPPTKQPLTKGTDPTQKTLTPTGPGTTTTTTPTTPPTKQPLTKGTDPAQKTLTPTTGTPGLSPSTQNAPLTKSGVPLATQQQTRPITAVTPGSGIVPQSANGAPLRRMDQLRAERRETKDGTRTIIREPDRTIIRDGARVFIRHNEVDRFRYGAQDVRVERRGNDNVTIVIRPGGERIVTIVDDDGYLLRRSRILADGREIVIIDNGPRRPRGPGFENFVMDLAPPVIRIPRNQYVVETEGADRAMIYDTLMAPPVEPIDRAYTLDQVRYNVALRDRMRRVDLNTITFDTASWEIAPDQLDRLAIIADSINRAIALNPSEVFLIEGHTDAVGADVDNLSLSDRRAESVALALTQQFNVPAENLTSQGYGEQFLKIPTQEAERANRRVAARRITPLITGQK
jgi:outer membrane protein OmpA-like peptidoglycan-associated protein